MNQDLAGHRDLTTTQRYMHLSPAAIEREDGIVLGGGESRSTRITWWNGAPKKMPTSIDRLMKLAGSTGLEPAASGVTGRRSNQLNYDP